jgi:hypothetical protein
MQRLAIWIERAFRRSLEPKVQPRDQTTHAIGRIPLH